MCHIHHKATYNMCIFSMPLEYCVATKNTLNIDDFWCSDVPLAYCVVTKNTLNIDDYWCSYVPHTIQDHRH